VGRLATHITGQSHNEHVAILTTNRDVVSAYKEFVRPPNRPLRIGAIGKPRDTPARHTALDIDLVIA